MSIREKIARWLSPDLARKADRYFYLRGRVDDAYRWLASYQDASDVAQWLRELDHDHWRGIDEPATGELPSQIDRFREIIMRRDIAARETNRQIRDINWQLGIGANPDTLDEAAKLIDCMPGCERGYTEFDTNAFVCSKIEDGECKSTMAEELRALAAAFRNRDALAPKVEDDSSAPVPISYHDLFITTPKIERTSIFHLPFRVRVICSRAAGWEVWAGMEGGRTQEFLGGEFNARLPLRLDVRGAIICDYVRKGDQ